MSELAEKSLNDGVVATVEKDALVKEGVLSSTSSGEFTYVAPSAAEDRKLTTKLDIRVIPIFGLLYLICFLDRTNIANARLAGLEKALHMPSNGFNVALSIFYIPFVLFEVPSNWIMSRPFIKPNLFLGAQTFILGVLAMCQGLTHSYGGLLAIRFLMGIVETSLPAGAGLLIASYYRKKELALRFAMFFAFGQMGACFSGLLAYALMDLGGPLDGWQWIFVVEGLVTIVFSVLVFIFCPNFPAKDNLLSEKDRAMLLARLEADKGKEVEKESTSTWLRAFVDYRVWLCTLLFFCADLSAGSLSSFNPTILSQLGWTARRAQVMTIPVWIVGTFVALTCNLLAGRLNKRWPFLLFAISLSLTGWCIHVTYQKSPVRYFAQFIISAGTFIAMPMYVGLLTANVRGQAYKGVATAIILGIGNCANFISSNIFITKQAPRYPVAFRTGVSITGLCFPVLALTIFLFKLHNKKIAKREAAGEVLDEQKDFKYVY
ncbi:uncharacterized protein PV09_08260 [Verruconis gallopava]|uniref:Major facilitator superfamily (MFS) profile domain-containing protein n=1 Tax=Verruconis gallopava TaxID=253628 RepID=A0A0D2A1L9_9PEZI|nr:uncharacterized protein PV09_08260 [Verruconis gallopava]KIW00220.1 hypothetical protein PV09_08260 [Verruconis gallopava]